MIYFSVSLSSGEIGSAAFLFALLWLALYSAYKGWNRK